MPQNTDHLNPGESLRAGEALLSANQNYKFVMQGDGNLVLYSGESPLWASHTNNKPVEKCVMQADGNLVLYDRSGHPVWASNTWGKPGAHLTVRDDGNVVIYETSRRPA